MACRHSPRGRPAELLIRRYMGVMCDAPLSAEEGQPSLEVSNIRLTRILKIEKQTRVDSERTENSLEQGDRLPPN